MAQPNQVALVTGGGTGIGKATALRFGAQGVSVMVVGRRLEPLEETVRQIQNAGGDAVAFSADLSDPDAPEQIMDTVAKTWGRLDVLVNNAAYVQHLPIIEATQEVFDLHIAVNLRAPYFLTQLALPYLKESGAASIVNISSSSGSFAIPGQSLYGQSKAALEYLSRTMAAELAPFGIRVNVIAPGPVDTPIHQVWAGDDVEAAYARMTSEIPLGRMGIADEVAAWIVFLTNPESAWVTGAIIPVDGGQTLPGALSKITS